ncbi:HTH domain-containing protein [Synechococcales cyanobacterium C]|uniref:HTH domain-containing protein n=1 Tax=Petrachloros mirabilis ULC683 TaxID=2781853 RepID=A0A8K1ZWH9_9CYAN|nr:HTH domain-containing protein [Petrachloros mirabilis]NCJ05351.1 HTH domain-containing protein [Petrachloros mirabilis ULC683]
MLRRFERVLQPDQLLRNWERTTAPSLGKELEVSERTGRYDLDFLRDRMGAPIACSRQRGYTNRNGVGTPTLPNMGIDR